jgi:hypothetical protein
VLLHRRKKFLIKIVSPGSALVVYPGFWQIFSQFLDYACGNLIAADAEFAQVFHGSQFRGKVAQEVVVYVEYFEARQLANLIGD